MKKSFGAKSICLFAALVLSMATVVNAAPPLAEKLGEISVTIKSNRGEGSGTLFVRKDGNATTAYVWTGGKGNYLFRYYPEGKTTALADWLKLLPR